ncbi:helix-turn-helix domain-containing protein [Bifidobacterium saguini]|uniref:helix-turn-helix domain-containing protein n=1 Tax=Bifidobacterium saguini TaxID=762210 RepID=UPI00068E596F|nr:helix-turn-helix domain-containing protein [Bifidobacterium saguini]
MTAGTLEKVYGLSDPRLTPAAGAVLAYYAYRSYYPDGRCAWPATAKVAESCFMDKKTVIRARDLLIELGYMRVAPDQTWNARDAETGEWKRKNNRTTVYDVLIENFHGVMDASEEGRAEREEERRETTETLQESSAKPRKKEGQNVTPRKNGGKPTKRRGGRMSPLANGHASEPEPNGDILSSERGQNVTLLTNNQLVSPLPPSVASPRGGESHAETGNQTTVENATPQPEAETDDGSWQTAETSDPGKAPARMRAEWLLDRLEARRHAMGLTVRARSRRDLDAVTRLVERLDAAGEDANTLMARILDHALESDWQAKRIDTGRRFARLFDQLRDDMTIDRRNLERRRMQSATTAEQTDPDHEAGSEPERREQAQRERAMAVLRGRLGTEPEANPNAAMRSLAQKLEEHPEPDPETLERLIATAIQDGREATLRKRTIQAEQEDRIEEYRAMHGGSCFAGNWSKAEAA